MRDKDASTTSRHGIAYAEPTAMAATASLPIGAIAPAIVMKTSRLLN